LARETPVEPETSDGIPDEMISFKIKELVKFILFTAIGYTKAKCVRKSVIKIGLIIQKWIATFRSQFSVQWSSIVNKKLSRYTPWRRLGGEEV
jgi:hypothetical protein